MESASSEPAWIPLHTAGGLLSSSSSSLLLSPSSFWRGREPHTCVSCCCDQIHLHTSLPLFPLSSPPTTIFSEFHPCAPFINPLSPLSALILCVRGGGPSTGAWVASLGPQSSRNLTLLHQFPVFPQVGMGVSAPSPVRARTLSGLVLCVLFMCATVLLWPGNTVSLQPPTS